MRRGCGKFGVKGHGDGVPDVGGIIVGLLGALMVLPVPEG